MDFKKLNVVQQSVKNIGKLSEATFKITRKDNKPEMDIDVLEDIVENMEKKAQKEGFAVLILIRVLTPKGWFTVKGFNSDLAVEEFDDYFKGTVKRKEKFEKFAQVQVTIQKYKLRDFKLRK